MKDIVLDGITYTPKAGVSSMTNWQPVETAPACSGDQPFEMDVWMKIPASPMTMGFSDSFRVPNAYRKGDRWFHRTEMGVEKELQRDYITHWMQIPSAPD
jgi:hypothetical protein